MSTAQSTLTSPAPTTQALAPARARTALAAHALFADVRDIAGHDGPMTVDELRAALATRRERYDLRRHFELVAQVEACDTPTVAFLAREGDSAEMRAVAHNEFVRRSRVICLRCDGSGSVESFDEWDRVWVSCSCPRCGGSGRLPQPGRVEVVA